MFALSTPIVAVALLGFTGCTETRDRGPRGGYDRGYDRGPIVDHRDHGGGGVHRGSDWELLGRTSVDSRSRPDRDVIQLGKRAGRFKRLDFRVDGGDIELYNMRVVYENGQVQTPNFRHMFDSRGRTRTIDLSGDARTLDRVEFSYRAVSGRPVVSLFGKTEF